MFEVEREKLVTELRKKGITDEAVLEAIGKVPRHEFINNSLWHFAYTDRALPIGSSQTISQPYTVAIMTQYLGIKPGCRILEIGTGSGYQAAVLSEMGAKVFSIEKELSLLKNTTSLLHRLKYPVITRYGDGTIGWNEYAPYDGVIVTAGSPEIPVSLKKQLKTGAKLIIPVGDKKTQNLYIVKRQDEAVFTEEVVPGFRFVPLIGKEGWEK